MEQEQLRVVVGLERGYLEAGSDEIEIFHGSFESYGRAALEISDQELEKSEASPSSVRRGVQGRVVLDTGG